MKKKVSMFLALLTSSRLICSDKWADQKEVSDGNTSGVFTRPHFQIREDESCGMKLLLEPADGAHFEK